MRAIGIVLAGGNSKRMKELSNKRAISAMPIAGSYRSIDFALSNMSNSNIKKVVVFTQYNSRSLNEHLSSSKWWDFGRKQGGLYVFTPTITAENSDWYRGTADALYQNLNFLNSCHEPYVVIAAGNCVYKLDYNKVLEYHIEKKADITVVCKRLNEGEDATRFGIVDINEDNIQFALVCDNKGDYDEIVTDVSLYFVENYQSNNMNNVHIAQSNELILLPKKSTVKNVLVGKLDLNRMPFDILLVNDKTYTIVLNISLVKNDNKIVTNELPVGMIKVLKNSNNGFISGDIQFIAQYRKVDFNKSKSVLTITSFPRTIEYDTFELNILK